MRSKTGFNRLFISAASFAIVATAIYYTCEEFLFSRRSSLMVGEIIAYVALVNIVTLIAIFAMYRAYLWILKGFKADHENANAPK